MDQGYFWVGVTYEERDGQTVADGTQLYVEFQKPEAPKPYPVVLIHGGGGQSLDWLGTPDGRPGWRTLLLHQGYAVYVVDWPGHGRSPRHPADYQGKPPLVPSVETIGRMFAGAGNPAHTQWPGTGERDDPALAQFLASQSLLAFEPGQHQLGQLRVVGLGLVGVGEGVLGERLVQLVAVRQVAGEQPRVHRPGVCPRGQDAREPAVVVEVVAFEGRRVDLALAVAELSHDEVPALDGRPAEQDVRLSLSPQSWTVTPVEAPAARSPAMSPADPRKNANGDASMRPTRNGISSSRRPALLATMKSSTDGRLAASDATR